MQTRTNELLLSAAREILCQGELLLDSLTDENYRTRIPETFHASIGGHFRHCLDHFEMIFAGLDAGVIDYDARRRDDQVETQRAAAARRTRELRESVERVAADSLSADIRVRCLPCYEGNESPEAGSTTGREFQYAVAHAIHHYAFIAVMCGLLGVTVPEGFGVAPSTLRHQQRLAVASA